MRLVLHISELRDLLGFGRRENNEKPLTIEVTGQDEATEVIVREK